MQLPGERLLIKLLGSMASGVGVATRPWVIKRDERAKALGKAEARRIERLSQEQLRQDIRDIKAGRKTIDADFRAIEPPRDEAAGSELARVSANYRLALQQTSASPGALLQLERRINLEQIASLAADEVEADDDQAAEPDEKEIEPDWFAQWRNRAQDVSHEDMQRLWARLLKGEATKAGSYSIHTMDFLSRMSRGDAELIAKIGTVALDGKFVHGTRKVLDSIGLPLVTLLYLSDLGVLGGMSGVQALSYNWYYRGEPGGRRIVMRLANCGLVFEPNTDVDEKLSLTGYPISTVGRELLSLASCDADLNYLKQVADSLRGKCKSISIGQVEQHDKSTGEYWVQIKEAF